MEDNDQSMEDIDQVGEQEAKILMGMIDKRTNLSENGCPTCGHPEILFLRDLKTIPNQGGGGDTYIEMVCDKCSRSQFFNMNHFDFDKE